MKKLKIKKYISFSFFIIIIFTQGYGQKITVSGQVVEDSSKEPLIGAYVYSENMENGIATNYIGFYSFDLPKGNPTSIIVSYVGFESDTIAINGTKDTTINFILESSTVLKDVVVTDKYEKRKENFGKIKLTQKELKGKTLFMGESDVLKVFQLMPGISFGNEGTSNLFVRGGSPDQNLILLDDAPIYNPTHLGGFLSVFDVNAIKEINVYKGDFPARYSGKLSSIIDVRLKNGHANEWKKELSLGVLSSKLFLEGPIKKEKTTILFSARRSFLDLLYRGAAAIQGADEVVGFSIYDVNLKLQHQVNLTNNITFQFYQGKDQLKYTSSASGEGKEAIYKNNINWGNTMGAISLKKRGKKYDLKSQISYTGYHYNIGTNSKIKDLAENEETKESNSFSSGINDFSSKTFVNYYFNSKLKVRSGVDFIFHRFDPQLKSVNGEILNQTNNDTAKINTASLSFELGLYSEWEYQINSKLSFEAGLNLATYHVPRENVHSIFPQPRLKLSYSINKDFLVFSSLSRMNQFSHLLSNSSAGFPSDLWVPATKKVRPSTADQIATGIHYYFNDNFYLTLEGFYKKMNHLIEFQEGTSFFRGSKDWQDKVALEGKGKVYGLEILLKRDFKKWNGYIAYTLSKNERQFGSLNNGNPFPYKYDRRHDLAISINYKHSKKVNLNVTWVYNTGVALTLPTQLYEVYTFDAQLGGITGFDLWSAEVYESRNSYRAPDYHRLDINCSFTKEKRNGKRVWNIGIYNVYNRINPYYIFFDVKANGKLTLNKLGLFPILPSISYNRSF